MEDTTMELTNRDSIPLGQPVMRWADPDENSSRWDYMVAAPSQSTLVDMWWGIGAVAVVSTISTFTVIMGILSSPNTRRSSFNGVQNHTRLLFKLLLCLHLFALGE